MYQGIKIIMELMGKRTGPLLGCEALGKKFCGVSFSINILTKKCTPL